MSFGKQFKRSLYQNLHQQRDGQLMQEKLLVMNEHRLTFEKSITSFKAMLFTNRNQLDHQRLLNQNLQTQIAQLVIPICRIDDRNMIIAPETAKKFKMMSDKLAVEQDQLSQEQRKINEIKNIFTP